MTESVLLAITLSTLFGAIIGSLLTWVAFTVGREA